MPLPPTEPPRRAPTAPTNGMLVFQTGVLVVAILYVAREVLVPVALAVLLGFVLAPITTTLRRLGLPRPVGVLIAVLAACALIGAIGIMLGGQLAQLAENLPTYQAALSRKLSGLAQFGETFARLQGLLAEVSSVGSEPGAAGAPAPMAVAIQSSPPSPLETLGQVADLLLHPLAVAGIVVILAIFVLISREDLRDRMIRLFGAQDPHRTMAAMDDAASRLSRYFLAQVALNSAFGAAMTGVLWAIGVPNPLLWGFLTGLMRFVPFLGTFISVAFPALLAMAVDPGWGLLIWVLAVYAIGEGLMGQVMEPLIFGHSTGLSAVAVMVAAVFWTWLWGPIGLVLAVPLTACLVVLGRHVDALAFLEVALGNQPPLSAEETFYQRALAGDAIALAEQADRSVKDMPLAVYLDGIALPALRFAQDDARRGVLPPDRAERLERAVGSLIEDLAEPDGDADTTPPPAWQEAGAVLCVPGRGRFDVTAATLLARLLAERGFGVQIGTAPANGTTPLMACLCVIEGGGSTAGARSVLRRLRRELPPALPMVVFAATANGDRPLADALLTDPAPPPLAASLVEARALVVTAAGVEAPVPVPEAA